MRLSGLLRHLPTHGTVVAYVALFVALGGAGAYAAGKIESGDIDSNAVKSKHIARGQVKGSDIAANTVKGRDIDEATLDGLAGEYAEVIGTAIVEQSGFAQRSGPEVTVDVGPSGLISVYAEAEIQTNDNNPQHGVVGLFEDGVAFPGLPDCGGGGAALIKAPDNITAFRRYTTGPPDATTDNCAGRERFGGPVVLRTTPGVHNYELRYASGGDGVFNTASFRERRLLVTPLP
jgi:hypothetical protein